MKSLWRSLRPAVAYRSVIPCRSEVCPGVTFGVRRISLARRIRLAEAIRALAGETEFHQAGPAAGHVEAAALSGRINQIYLDWGLARIDGLTIDGENATGQSLYADGPEALLHEIVARIKTETGLSSDERKN